MRLPGGPATEQASFSPEFLDTTLQKILALQNDMLRMTADLAKAEGVDKALVQSQAKQSADLSRIVALICAEKARQAA